MSNDISSQLKDEKPTTSMKAALVLALIGCGFIGPVMAQGGALGVLILIWPLCFVGLLFTGVIYQVSRSGQRTTWLRKRCEQILIAGVISLIVWPFMGIYLQSYPVNKAKTFCQTLITRLEVEKKQQGSYPDDITPLIQDHQNIPPLIRRALSRRFYDRTEDGHYRLLFNEPAGMFPVQHYYSSATRQWEVEG